MTALRPCPATKGSAQCNLSVRDPGCCEFVEPAQPVVVMERVPEADQVFADAVDRTNRELVRTVLASPFPIPAARVFTAPVDDPTNWRELGTTAGFESVTFEPPLDEPCAMAPYGQPAAPELPSSVTVSFTITGRQVRRLRRLFGLPLLDRGRIRTLTARRRGGRRG